MTVILFRQNHVLEVMETPNFYQRSSMVTVIRAWLRKYGCSSILCAIAEAMKRERRRTLADSIDDRTIGAMEGTDHGVDAN